MYVYYIDRTGYFDAANLACFTNMFVCYVNHYKNDSKTAILWFPCVRIRSVNLVKNYCL